MAKVAIPEVESKNIVSAHRGGLSWGLLLVILALLLVAFLRSSLDAIPCMHEGFAILGYVVGTAYQWNTFRDTGTLTVGKWNSFRTLVGQRQPRICTNSAAIGEGNSLRPLFGSWIVCERPESVPCTTISTTNQSLAKSSPIHGR